MPQAPLVVIVAGEGTVKEKAEQWLREWRVRTEGSGVAHGGNIVCNGLNFESHHEVRSSA